jgi:hypothetical protein
VSLAVRWRAPPRTVSTRWRGPLGMLEALGRDPALPVAAIVGPPGPAGPQGPAGAGSAPLRLDAALAATWVLSHGLGRVPTVQVYLSTGEAVVTDLAATTSQITVTFPSPQQGFVLAF